MQLAVSLGFFFAVVNRSVFAYMHIRNFMLHTIKVMIF